MTNISTKIDPADPGHSPVPVVIAGKEHLLLAIARVLQLRHHPVVVSDDLPATVEDWVDAGYVTLSSPAELPRADTAWFRPGTRVVVTGLAPTVWAPWLAEQQDITHEVMHDRRAPCVGEVDILHPGSVALVGAGPGPSSCLTLGAWNAIAQADVVVTDRLVPVSALAAIHRDAELIDVAKIPHGRSTTQEVINQTLVAQAKAGRKVVRLKGGDPFVFGRGYEEALACSEASVDWTVCSGVSSAVAVPASCNIPVTHRGVSQSVTIVSGHVAPGDSRSTTDWHALAKVGGTIVVLMGVASAARIAAELHAGGLPATLPVAACRDRGNLDRHELRSTLLDVSRGAFDDLTAPAVLIFGAVADPSLS